MQYKALLQGCYEAAVRVRVIVSLSHEGPSVTSGRQHAETPCRGDANIGIRFLMSAVRASLLFFALICGCLLPGMAQAQTCTHTFSTLAFPTTMDVLPGTAIDTASSVATNCTGITGTTRVLVCYSLNNGTYPLSGGLRQMGSGANRLRFNAYTTAAYSTVWNATNQIQVALRSTVPSATTFYYGRVAAAQQTAIPGVYSTTMTVTIRMRTYTGTTIPACPTGASTTATFNVTGTVVSSCIATATNLTFPSTSFFTANIDASSAVNVTCTNTTPYNVRLNGGTTGAANPALRKMTLGLNQITYGLYRDVARTLGWGSTDGTNTAPGTGTASAISHTVYGRIPPQASQPAGTYTDTIVVTVSFL